MKYILFAALEGKPIRCKPYQAGERAQQTVLLDTLELHRLGELSELPKAMPLIPEYRFIPASELEKKP